MFQVTIAAPFFKAVISALKELTDIVTIKVDESGMEVDTLDDTSVCFLHMRIVREELIHIEVDAASYVTVCVGDIDKMLRSAKKEILLSKTADDDLLTMEFKGDCGQSKYSIPQCVRDSQDLNIPSQEYGASVSIYPTQLYKLCNELKVAGQDTEMIIDKQSAVQFRTTGDKQGKAIIAMPEVATLKTPVDFRVKFKLIYLQKMCKLYKICEQTDIHLSEDPSHPFQVVFTSEKGSRFKYILATMT